MPENKDITDPSVKFSTYLGLVSPIPRDDLVRNSYLDGYGDGCKDTDSEKRLFTIIDNRSK